MKVCHYLPGDMGGGGYPEIVTNGGMGEEDGPKIAIFAVTSFLKGSYHLLNLDPARKLHCKLELLKNSIIAFWKFCSLA